MHNKEENIMTNEKILVTQSSMPPYEEYIEAIKPLWLAHQYGNLTYTTGRDIKRIFGSTGVISYGEWTYGVGISYSVI